MGLLKTHAVALLCILLVTGYFALQVRSIENLRQTHPGFSEEAWNAMPNNGRIATAFAVHINPYHMFSEDFHLYFLRARRIARFGFVSDILEPSQSRRYDFRNIIQVLVCLPMALWGHTIPIYAGFIWLYLALAYSSLYAVNYRLVKDSAFALLSCAAVFLALGSRGLRVSTYLLSVPVLIAGLSMLIFGVLLKTEAPPTVKRLFPVTFLLAVLGLWDVWSFLFLFFAFVVFGTCYSFIQIKGAGHGVLKKVMHTGGVFSLAMAPVLTAVLINRPAHEDLLKRAGFFVSNTVDFSYLEPVNLLKTVLLYGGAALLLRGLKSVFFAVSALLLFSFAVVVSFSVFILRMEPYAFSHFYVLFQVVWLWWLCISVFSPAPFTFQAHLNVLLAWCSPRGSLVLFSAAWRRFLYAACVVLFLCLGFRFYRFSPQERYPQFAIPRKYEELIQYLNTSVKEQKARSLLTLSHELNLLLAYHTDFDLLLPEGFPLYSSKTNQEVFDRMAAISHFLDISPVHWGVFLRQDIPQAQLIWVLDRELSEGANYLYYLFHRHGTDQLFAETKEKQSVALKHKLCEEVLSNPAVLAELPEFVVSEGTYKVLRLPPPSGYDPVFERENVTLYQKKV